MPTPAKRWRLGAGSTTKTDPTARSGTRFRYRSPTSAAPPASRHDEAREFQNRAVQTSGSAQPRTALTYKRGCEGGRVRINRDQRENVSAGVSGAGSIRFEATDACRNRSRFRPASVSVKATAQNRSGCADRWARRVYLRVHSGSRAPPLPVRGTRRCPSPRARRAPAPCGCLRRL